MKRLYHETQRIFFLAAFVLTFFVTPLAHANALPKIVVMGTNQPGSVLYACAAAFAKVIGDHLPIKVEVVPQGSGASFAMMQRGEMQFALALPDDILTAYKGELLYNKPTKGKGFSALRTFDVGSPVTLGLIVPGDSDIKGPQDIKGKRMPVNFGSLFAANLTVRALLADYGLTPEDVKGQTVTSYVAGVRALIEHRVDLTFGVMGSGIIQQLKVARGVRFLPLDNSPQAIARMKKVFPGYYASLVKPVYPGVTKEMYALTKDMTMVCARQISDHLAYSIIKVLWNHYKEYQPIHPKLRTWTPDRFASINAVVPYHPGVIKFYKDVGVWTKALEEHQEELLAIK